MSETPAVTSQFEPATGIGRIVLNRPERLNAIDRSLADGFRDAVRATLENEGLRCILILSTGRAFAAGGDLTSLSDPATAGQEIDGLLTSMHIGLIALKKAGVPVVTAVHGAAAGGGLSLALVGDLVFAAESAKFSIAYTRVGGVPDCGLTWALAQRIGAARTLEMLLCDATVDAKTARAMGMVTEVFADADFSAAVEERVARLAKGPTLAFASCRATLTDVAAFEKQLEREREAFVRIGGTRDFGEGVAAFLSRREAVFQGR